jgi:peptidoglycan/LPS O-acetylase OafA/YrhL
MTKNSYLLGSLGNSRNNNFDFIRSIAAVMVIFSHSFTLALGDNRNEWLSVLTHKQVTFGTIAVSIFFVVSGYLITQSYDKSKNIIKFIKARALRIIPALIAVVIMSTFILGPFITKLSMYQYFTCKETYGYLRAIFIFKMPYTLPGVFCDNPYPNAVNGSLWTLVTEAKCYIITGGLGALKLLRKQVILIIFIGIYLLMFFNYSYSLYLFTCFFIGSLLYMYREKIRICNLYLILSIIFLIIGGMFGFLKLIFPLFGGYLVIDLAFNQKLNLHNFSKYGDFSYGLYIYAFPIQQLIVYISKYNINTYLLFLIALPIILIFSVLSWFIIEKPCLKLKNIKNVTKFSIKNLMLKKSN